MNRDAPSLILASTSRYRRALLERFMWPFEVVSPNVEETPLPHESPADLSLRLAMTKAQAVAGPRPEAFVVGSDQVCELRGRSLGKPGTPEKAAQQLHQLSGQSVVFHTAVAVIHGRTGFAQAARVSVDVRFRTLSDALINRYLELEPAHDCAGSAKCEGLGIALLEWVNSDDPTALVGLPLIETSRLLRQAGLDVLA